MDSENTINIAVAADSCFAPGMLVAVGSMLLNGNKAYKYHFYVLDCGLTDRDKDDFRQLMKKFAVETEVEFMHPDLSRFYSLPTWRGNYAAYARLLLHEILPDVKYMLYTDVDTYWGCDCAQLWAMRSDEKSILASSNSLERNLEGGFFNSAVCIMNLERMRKLDFTVRMMEWSQGREFKYPDMEILNGVLVDDKVIIDSLWDMQEPVKWDGAFAKPCVIHYTRNKPWLSRTRAPYFVLSIPWWEFYFKYLGKNYSWKILWGYIRGKLRYNLFSRPGFVAKYASFRKLKPEKRQLLEDMFTFDSARNQGCWFAERQKSITMRLAIVGSASLGRQIAGHAKFSGKFKVVGFFDDFAQTGEDILGKTCEIIEQHEAGKFDYLAIGVGYSAMAFRDGLCKKLLGKVPLATIEHGNVWIDPTAKISEGCILMNGCSIDQRAEIGRNCFLSLAVTVSHDSKVGASSYLSPKVTVCGNCEIGERVFLGAGCVIRDGVTVCSDAIVGAGAIVTKNITEPGIYLGNPARPKAKP